MEIMVMGLSIPGQSAALGTLVAAFLGLVLALVIGKLQIQILGRRLRERIVSDSPRLARLHRPKSATPTMGGLFVVAAILTALTWTGNWADGALPAVALMLLGLTAVGVCDDFTKLRRGVGLRAKQKLAAQFLVAAAALGLHWAWQADGDFTHRWIPGLGTVDLDWGVIPLGILAIVGTSNAVNLTDGLDGLAGGCLIVAFIAFGAVALLAEDVNLAATCGVLHMPTAGVPAVVCGAALGAVLGFLMYNRHPARVFLGDAGSLPLGGLLGLIAVSLRQELLLIFIGGVFVAEAGSVMLQVGYYKLRQHRIFLCAPLHHHFQFLGWEETKIVRRFWMAAVVCAITGTVGWSFSSSRLSHGAVQGQIPPPLQNLSCQLAGANNP